MEIEVSALTLGESTNVDDVSGLDAHAFERRQVRNRGNDQVTAISEADEASVKQVVNAGGQEQSVLTIEALFVRGIAPRLAMARHKVNRVVDARV